jgi:hypothetical protein
LSLTSPSPFKYLTKSPAASIADFFLIAIPFS